jgi:hypothetical protein
MFVPNGIAAGASVLVNCAVQLGLLAVTVGMSPSMNATASIVAAANELLFRTSPTSFCPAVAIESYARHPNRASGEQVVVAAEGKASERPLLAELSP